MRKQSMKIIIPIVVLLSIAAAVACVTLIFKHTKKVVSSDVLPSVTASDSFESSDSSPEATEPEDNGIRLVLNSPQSTAVTVTEPDFSFSGTSDPLFPLLLNGTEIERREDGVFTYSTKLNVGKNSFTFEHKGETYTYTVTYRYVIIKDYSPANAQTFPSGSTLVVNVTARKGSTVTAAFNGTTITLSPTADDVAEGNFTAFNGMFKLPENNIENLSLGKITFKATHDGKSESFSSGKITCKKTDLIVDYDPNATPTGGKYINVGSGYIAEIVEYNAETFDGNITAQSLKDGSVDWSRPTNNYLPKGTLDYCSSSLVSYKESEYVTLRAGYRVYRERQDKPYTEKKPVVRQYLGSLPDHNEIAPAGIETVGNHTVITFDCLWKAPFYFDILPQSYVNPSKQDYRIENVTYNYIDITFCYATSFTGEIFIPDDHPLFESATVIENKNADGSAIRDFTLRLFLKKQGGFYGWDSYYNENSQLVFEFLNPAVTAEADTNEYSADLSRAKILIDVGHGGKDSGAVGKNGSGSHYEKDANLSLAFKIKAELEKTGATVYMTRSDDITSSTDDKIQLLRQLKPDYCIAIHHNSNTSPTPNGFGSYYFNAYSKKASEFVLDRTNNTGIYNNKNQIFKWHYYFVCRSSVCPVVLTENGFMSNVDDLNGILNDQTNTEKAKAIVRGIADYFKYIRN